MRPIDADELVKDGYVLHRTYQQDKKTMVYETKRIEDVPTVQIEPKWIPCSEQMPEEHDSIFKRYYGTDRWRNTMFQSSSEKVITTCEFADGTRFTETNMTCDGKWRTDEYPPRTVIAWTPLPEPYKGGAQE